MAGYSYTPWYVRVAVEAINWGLAALAVMVALRVGGVFGWTAFGVGAFAMFEFSLWVDWQWPDMRS